MIGERGQEIAGYRIESEIGRGGMGVVYLATQVFPERKVALKLLSPDLAADPAFRERFVHESNAAASTEHPNIVPVYAAGESDGQLYLAMRFVEGTDLHTLLEREGPLQPERAAKVCAEIADALEAAHERGLIHRDVKPGNVLLDVRERAYLTDFGLTRRTRIDTGITKTGQFMGTVDYVAPEQIRGEVLDGRADVYSLGCVLYECLTGTPPFRRDSEVATMYAHLEEAPPRPSSVANGVPRELDATVARSMATRPEERFATAGEMARALRGVGPSRGASPGRRRRFQVGIATAAIVAIAAIAAVSSMEDDPAAPPSTGPAGGGTIPLDSLARIDAETGEISATTSVPAIGQLTLYGGLPLVEVGEGGVWVLSGDTVTHVDPDDSSVVEEIPLGSPVSGSDSLAVGYRTVWVGTVPGMARIDPIDDDHLRPVRLFEQPGAYNGVEVALGNSSVWAATGDGELTRVDPETAEPTGSNDVGPNVSGLDVGFDAIWIVDELDETLTRVDAATLEAGDPVPLAGEPNDVAVGAGAVWILDSTAGVVTPFDPTSGRPGSPVRVGLEPTDLAIGLDAVWVANHGEGTISRIDPVTKAVETIEVGAPVASIAVDESTGSLWITVAERGATPG
ncbi:MAG TPA: protein kinase [Actinomycetota bacterium]|nr:protein kinase [Actinomycetota bacterium]